ncbi:MAG TPA: M20/M25/M40 family metallo-hydrolase [Thermoplasmata archaeon]|nr:M20/M25/M40 family metallo-hydrolase [Thermoplasmata archaeon]
MAPPRDGPAPDPAAQGIGAREGLELLQSLVAIAPTNLEDPISGRFEKPNYVRAVDEIARWARRFGLATRRFDPLTDLPPNPQYRGIPRPNLVVDLSGESPDRILILAHYDVVPVPSEQLAHWKSPPHALTRRADGRLYGRGANDDLGSGVVSSLLAMRRLADSGNAPRSVRLLVCCDEETGGLGGIEAIKHHDLALPDRDPERFLDGSVALIPDGSPHATAASSGLVFLDGTFRSPASTSEIVQFGRALEGLSEIAHGHRSIYPSPDWPDHGAPDPVITGRATLTRFDVDEVPGAPDGAISLVVAHAENDAPNQIAAAVTLGFRAPDDRWDDFVRSLRAALPPPFRLESPANATALQLPPGVRTIQLAGVSAHGGYPHRGANPVSPALALLERAIALGWLSGATLGRASFSVDLRLIPEMALEAGRGEALRHMGSWLQEHLPSAQVDAPLARARGGYALPIDHPAVQKLERLLAARFGEHGVFGEYGGTDASSLAGIRTPQGAPLPALVFGSMDRSSHIHEAEESADPRSIGLISEAIEAFVREP